jgi:hypothetical protein
MKKIFFTAIFVSVLSIGFYQQAQASYFGFGGKIISVPATEIIAAESAGYLCPQRNLTFTIKPVSKSPVSYIATNLNRNSILSSGRNILGLYTTSISVPCMHSSGILGATFIPLSSVILYGTSVGY